MGQLPATIELIGRSSAWSVRVPVPAEQSGALRAQRPVVAGWLHHRAYGTLGVYLTDAPGAHGLLPEARQWIRLAGVVQPCRLRALHDDPRSATNPLLTPLAISASYASIASVLPAAANSFVVPQLVPAQHARLLPGRRCGAGTLAPTTGMPDVSFWQPSGMAITPIASWDCIGGVVSSLGPQQLVRYIIYTRPRESMYG